MPYSYDVECATMVCVCVSVCVYVCVCLCVCVCVCVCFVCVANVTIVRYLAMYFLKKNIDVISWKWQSTAETCRRKYYIHI
jgi:hypothetical protein